MSVEKIYTHQRIYYHCQEGRARDLTHKLIYGSTTSENRDSDLVGHIKAFIANLNLRQPIVNIVPRDAFSREKLEERLGNGIGFEFELSGRKILVVAPSLCKKN